MSSPKTSSRFRFTGAALLLTVLVFLIPALRNGDPSLYLLAVLVPCALFLCCTVLARMFSLDRILLVLSLYLCAVGIAALAQADPRAALAQALRCGIALVFFGFTQRGPAGQSCRSPAPCRSRFLRHQGRLSRSPSVPANRLRGVRIPRPRWD